LYSSAGRKRLPLFLLSVSVVIVLADCSPPLTHKQAMVANRPQKKTFKVRADVLREAVERALEKKKFTLDTKRSNQLHVQSQWLKDGRYRSMAVADIKPEARSRSQLSLQLYLEKKAMFSDEWKPMDEIGEDTYRVLLGDIEMECYRVLYEGT
jgi:hypothetical protein